MGLLKWGDMYKRTDALGFTISEDALYRPPRLASVPCPSYNIREDLFETDEDTYLELVGKDLRTGTVGSAYPTYAPSQQRSSFNLKPPAIGEDDDDEIYFPSYDDIQCGDNFECMVPATETKLAANQPASTNPIERSEDDSAIRVQPSRHVDYLSQDWSEEDVWASWRHIVSKRGAYNNSARLENASWRSWAKKRSNLRTVPPETVKWMKDHDLTWLYGPLMPGSPSLKEPYKAENKGRRLSRTDIARHSKKPILKKRSLSEIMLRRSISSSSLLKRAVVPKMRKDNIPTSSPFESPALTRSTTVTLSSKSTTGLGEASEGWKKVQFHELVEQCIALVNAGDEEREYQYCSDSDDDVIVMRKAKKRVTSTRLPSAKQKVKSTISKTIEKLPHAILKDTEVLGDVPEEIPEGISDSDSTSLSYPGGILDSISNDRNSDEEDQMDWQPPAWLHGRRDSVQIVKDRLFDFKMHQGEVAQDEVAHETKHPHRPQLERMDAVKEEQKDRQGLFPSTKEGNYASINFTLPPICSQLASSRYQRPRDDYFMVDPRMTEDDPEDIMDMPQPSSQLSEASDNIEVSGPSLDHFQRLLIDRVMGEFWALFNQQWDTYSSQGNVFSPVSPTGSNTSLLVRKRRRSSCQQHPKGTGKSSYFENVPEEAPASPDSKELADYESYIHRELPSSVHRSIEDVVRRTSQPIEAHIVGNLVNIIHDCEENLFQSYLETALPGGKGLGVLSMDASNTSTRAEADHHHSEILNAAFHQPPSQYMSHYQPSLLRSSTISSPPASPFSVAPATPRETVFSDSGYASQTTSMKTSPDPNCRVTDSSKYSLPRVVRGKDGRSIREMDLYEYDELDEAIAWAMVY